MQLISNFPGEDILDVWFDSGISWHTFAAEESQKVFYVEGRDQIRGWFQSSISTAYALNQRPPFTHIYTHGFVLDHRNTKVSPKDVMLKFNCKCKFEKIFAGLQKTRFEQKNILNV